MYVAVKGGERAIENAHRLLAHARRGDQSVPEITLDQISEQLGLAVDRVMSEGSLYDRELAALASRSIRGPCACNGGCRRPSRTFPAARSSGRPSTIPIACSIPRSLRAL